MSGVGLRRVVSNSSSSDFPRNQMGSNQSLKMDSSAKRIEGSRVWEETGVMRSNANLQSHFQGTLRQGNRGFAPLSEDRLQFIAKRMLGEYGSGNEIGLNGLMRIQKQAHAQSTTQPQLTHETAEDLLKVLDQNKDKRVNLDDIVSVCRRYLSCEKRPIHYSVKAEEKLAVARRLFEQFDSNRVGYLTEQQVPNLLNETYRALGKAFNAKDEDVKAWMQLTNSASDGIVTFAQYEQSIIRALTKQGIQIYSN